MIDFGLLAVSALANFQADVQIGDFVSGEISVELPLCIEPIPHELITRMGRQWQVDGISADLTPYQDGRRDITQIAYKEVASTEEAKAFDYVLNCTELGPSTVPYPISPAQVLSDMTIIVTHEPSSKSGLPATGPQPSELRSGREGVVALSWAAAI